MAFVFAFFFFFFASQDYSARRFTDQKVEVMVSKAYLLSLVSAGTNWNVFCHFVSPFFLTERDQH